jgi:hypothetical protein
MYHKSLNIKDLSFILDNILDQQGKVSRSTVGTMDPTELVHVKAYFYKNYPFAPADVAMFENTVCGDCGFIIKAGTCACQDRSLDVDTRYCITVKYFMGDAFYKITSKDLKERIDIKVYSMDEAYGRKGDKTISEEDSFYVLYTILREAHYISEEEYNRSELEQELVRAAEEADQKIGYGM